MRIKVFLLASMLALVCGTYKAGAQNWSSFGYVLSQMDSDQRAGFLSNLDSVQLHWNTDSLALGSELDSLNNAIFGLNPAGNLDSLTADWTIGRDSLQNMLPGSSLGGSDPNDLLTEFDRINDLWYGNNDQIIHAFDQYQVNLTGQLPPQGASFDTLDSKHQLGLDSVNVNMLGTLTTTPTLGNGQLSNLFNQLFKTGNFNALEIFAGVMNAKGEYYSDNFSKTAHVLGVRSVEQFDRTWEPRWAFQYSGTTEPFFRPANPNDENGGTTSPNNSKFNPLAIDGHFSVMYNLDLGDLGNGSVTLISLLGIEVGTFCPSYREFDLPYTNNNKGFTTGFGPQIGGGFATRNGQITAYTLGTLSYGDINLGNPGYHYLSAQLEAGIRYGNHIVLKVRTGNFSWAPQEHKAFSAHQVTVGVPIGGLFH